MKKTLFILTAFIASFMVICSFASGFQYSYRVRCDSSIVNGNSSAANSEKAYLEQIFIKQFGSKYSSSTSEDLNAISRFNDTIDAILNSEHEITSGQYTYTLSRVSRKDRSVTVLATYVFGNQQISNPK